MSLKSIKNIFFWYMKMRKINLTSEIVIVSSNEIIYIQHSEVSMTLTKSSTNAKDCDYPQSYSQYLCP